MSFTVTVANLDRAIEKLAEKKGAFMRAVLRGTFKAGMLVRGKARAGIEKSPKEGNEYFHSGRGKKTRASKPGTPPANQTGHLMGGINVVSRMETPDMAVAVVSSTAEYAAAQEFGTLDGRLPERPYMRPALEASKGEIAKVVEDEIRKAAGV